MGLLSLAILGGLDVRHAGRPITFKTRKTAALLIYLAVESGLHTRERLAALLWPESAEARARASLRRAVSDLQGCLRHAVSGDHSRHITADHQRIGLDSSADLELDLRIVDAAVSLARTPGGEPSDQLAARLRAATRVYRGDVLEGFSIGDAPDFEAWVTRQREAWRRRAELVFERLAQELEDSGELAEAIDAVSRWVGFDPLNEAAYRRLMRLHFAAGDRSKALHAYARCQAILAEDLGADPAPETEALAKRIRAEAPTGLEDHREMVGEPGPSLLADPRLVGRSAEHARLVAAFRAARKGRAQAMVLEGEPGIGKSRLAREFARWAAASGADVLRGRAFETGGRLPYQPLVEALRSRLERENAPEDLLSDIWLAELSRLLPELLDRYPDLVIPPGDDLAARARLFEAVTRLGAALAARAPMLLEVDDLQWVDSASLDLLQYALRRWAAGAVPVLLVICVRSEDVLTTPTLADWLTGLGRDIPVTHLTLGPITAEDTRRLVRSLGDADSPTSPAPGVTDLESWLFAETGGVPFFVVETLKALIESGALRVDALDGTLVSAGVAPVHGSIAPSVQELVRTRLTRLSPTARVMLVAAAVLGHGFDFERMCQVAGLAEHVGLDAFDELLVRSLVQTHDHGYQFGHDRIREVVYADAGAPRRRLYHQRALEVLEGAGAPAAELVRHAEAAELSDRALELSAAAGDAAMRVFAAREAVRHYERARTRSGSGIHSALRLKLGRAYELAMDYTSARDVYTALRSEAHDADDPRVECAALNRLATLAETAGFDLEAQGAYLEAAQALAVASDDQAGKAETLWNLARHSVFRLALTEALSQSQQALELARGLDVQELVGRNLNWLALVESLVGAWTDALTHAEEAQAIFAALGDTVMRADSMAIAAGVYTMLGQPKRAVAVARQAYAMNLEIDNRAGVADAGEELARGLLDCGEYGEALEVSHATVSAARDSGQTMALIGTLALLGGIQRAIGAIDAALAAHREAEVRAESMHFPLFSEHIAAELCADYAALGDWAQAAKQARRALAARAQHSACYVGRTRWCETEALVRAGELAQAVDDVQRFGARVGGSPRLRIAYLRAQAVVDLAHRQLTQAIDGLEAARKLAQACDLIGELWPIAAALSKLYQQCGDAIEAERAMAEAQQITEGLATQLVDEDLRMALRAVVNRATQ